MPTSANDVDEIIEGEFEVTGGDIPIPTELVEEGGGSARYPLPDELVRYEYPRVMVPATPQTASLTERIVMVSPAETDGAFNDLASYEAEFERHQRSLSLQIATLRSLQSRLHVARQHRMRLQMVRELERVNLNHRNNVTNQKIEDELTALRQRWEENRARFRDEIRETEDALISYKMSRQGEIEEARKTYWEARQRVAMLRDEEERQERERRRREADADAEQARLNERERREEQKAARNRAIELTAEMERRREEMRQEARQRAEIAEREAQEAEAVLATVEKSVLERHTAEIEATWQRYQAARQEAAERLEHLEAELRAAAEAAETELRLEERRREEALHAVICEHSSERDQRERAVHEAKVKLAQAQARLAPEARNLPSESPTEPGSLSEGVVAAQTDTAHLATERRTKFQDAVHKTGNVLAHVALGSIFGVSLAILTGFGDLSPEGLEKTWGIMAVICVLGIFIFYLMGKLAYRTTAFATEEFNAARNTSASVWPIRPWFAAIKTAAVIVGMIAIEAYVERYGIVDAVMLRDQEMGGTGELDPEKAVAYWMIALIVSAPFVIYHAYEGAMETRYRLGEKRRREELEKQQYHLATAPDVVGQREAQQTAQAMEERWLRHAQETDLRRIEAERRLAEMDALRQNHPALLRWKEFQAGQEEWLERDIAVVEARGQWEQAQDNLTADPVLTAAKERALTLRDRASEARRQADAVSSSLVTTLRDALGQNIASAGTGTAQTMGEEAGPLLGRALDATVAGLPSAATTTAIERASDLMRPLATLNNGAEAAVRSEFATWEETVARERWDSIRNAIAQDPQVRFYQNRIQSLRSIIHSEDTVYGKRRKQLLDQKRAVEVRFLEAAESNRATDRMTLALEEAEKDEQAREAELEEALLLFRRLADTPILFRWIERLRQRFRVQTISEQRLIAVRNGRNATTRALPATSNQ